LRFAFIIRDNFFPFFFGYIASLGIVPDDSAQIRITAVRKHDSFAAFGTVGGFKGWRIFQFGKIVLVGAVPSVHFQLMTKKLQTFFACFPVAAMFVFAVEAAKGKSPMVSGTTIAGVRKYHVVALVVANPFAAAGGFSEFFARAAAQAAARFYSFCNFCFGFGHKF